MGQILHGSAKTTHVIRAAIQRPKASLQELAEQYDLNPKRVAKWRQRSSVEDMPIGSKQPRSTVLSAEEEAMCIALQRADPAFALDGLQPDQPFPQIVPRPTKQLVQRMRAGRNFKRCNFEFPRS